MGELNLVSMARELLQIHENIFCYVKNPAKTRISDFELETFVQTWGSTSGGFEGVGGCAMTPQRTYVFIPFNDDENCLVFFGGRYAYSAPYSQAFKNDLQRRNMTGVSTKGKYWAEVE